MIPFYDWFCCLHIFSHKKPIYSCTLGLQVKCRGRDLQENFQNMTLKNISCQIIHVLFTNGTNGVKVYSKLNFPRNVRQITAVQKITNDYKVLTYLTKVAIFFFCTDCKEHVRRKNSNCKMKNLNSQKCRSHCENSLVQALECSTYVISQNFFWQ